MNIASQALPSSYPLLIKPASSACNLRCQHCFYTEKKLYDIPMGRMSAETLEKLITEYAKLPLHSYNFIWQGGEPTLMGLDFYKLAIKLQKTHLPSHAPVENYLQTNASLIDDEFAAFLSQEDFLVGISIDGQEDFHNHYRVFADGTGSFTRVMQSYELLKKHKVKTNVLTLISSYNVEHIAEIYSWLKSEDVMFQQYIPCVEFNDENKPEKYSVTPKAFGNALCRLFDAWIKDRCVVNIRYFEALLQRIILNTPGMCQFGKSCKQYAVVEHNGDIYPCDFFVEERLILGNIKEHTFEEMIKSKKYEKFNNEKTNYSLKCKQCQYLTFCFGDCQKHRIKTKKSKLPHSWLCEAYQIFFAYALPELQKISAPLLRHKLK